MEKLTVFFAQADNTGCGYYRSQLPATALKLSGAEVSCAIPSWETPELTTADVVVLQMQVHPRWLQVMQQGRKNGCKYIYEIDDDLWNMHPSVNNYEQRITDRQHMIEIMSVCDAVIASTALLAARVRPYNQNVYVWMNYIVEPSAEFPVKNGKVRIGFSGGSSHAIDFEMPVVNALLEIKRRYADKVDLIFLGYMPQTLIGDALFFNFVEPRNYLAFLRELSFDIGIIPCKDIPFNQTRSCVKFLEYSINKTATIASDILPYHILSDQTGILVRNKYKYWLNALDRLVRNAGERQKLGDNAYDFVKANYMLQDKVQDIRNLYEAIARG